MNKWKKTVRGGITAYVMVMFGLIVIMMLMGFETAWQDYTNTGGFADRPEDTYRDIPGSGNKTITSDITDSETGEFNILNVMIEGIKGIFITPEGETNWWSVIATIGGAIALGTVAKLTGGQYAFAYIIPIGLFAIFANIFIFPIHHTDESMSFFNDAIPLNVVLIVFFNLWLLLAIIEFVRGQTT